MMKKKSCGVVPFIATNDPPSVAHLQHSGPKFKPFSCTRGRASSSSNKHPISADRGLCMRRKCSPCQSATEKLAVTRASSKPISMVVVRHDGIRRAYLAINPNNTNAAINTRRRKTSKKIKSVSTSATPSFARQTASSRLQNFCSREDTPRWFAETCCFEWTSKNRSRQNENITKRSALLTATTVMESSTALTERAMGITILKQRSICNATIIRPASKNTNTNRQNGDRPGSIASTSATDYDSGYESAIASPNIFVNESRRSKKPYSGSSSVPSSSSPRSSSVTHSSTVCSPSASSCLEASSVFLSKRSDASFCHLSLNSSSTVVETRPHFMSDTCASRSRRRCDT